ncbi:sigma 54-interacting transcriptional regulator [Xanthobacter sp. VNH20]|uniref:sigma-54-dependent Fis family transcriptional regulator n=1 Tax=Xanthobacter sp. VNH20 TaxID=3156616 RepID=UPI0032B3FBE4
MASSPAQAKHAEQHEDEPPAYWRAQEMLLIQQIIGLIGKGLQVEHILHEMLHLLSEMLGLNRGRIVLWDAESALFKIQYSYGLTAHEKARGIYRAGEGITGRALAHEQLIIVQDIDQEPDFLFRAVDRATLPQEPVAFLVIPIRVERRTVGVLGCHRIRNRSRPFSDDITILRICSTLAGQVLELNEILDRKTRALEEHNQMLARALETHSARYGIIGTAPALLKALAELELVAAANANVLLLGESGTGKEVFARALHLASPRRDRPFIKVNCAAIPESLFESELFGYERGAFTGASEARAGWFEQAGGGTILLDEIGELPLAMQTKLLRTLQEGTVTRLGGKKEIKVDARLVAATNRNLEREVAAGRFREDLYYRINVIPIRLPTLAERRDDIPALAMHFVSRFNEANQRNVNLTTAAMARLREHPWPGNIRQLSNFIERLVLLTDKPSIDAGDLAPFLSAMAHVSTQTAAQEEAALRSLVPARGGPAFRPYLHIDSHSAEDLRRALAQSGGNKSRAAQSLGLTARQFAYRWQKAELDSEEGAPTV